jgi:2-keto-4-pentenoate hydratase/2-oxohepta-3-ene-1,7-dioic acid hydratase in catechol pathway
MWNNFHQLAHAQGWELPEFPFYFLKPASCLNGPDADIPHPPGYKGRIIYEGELGVVIGKRCKDVTIEQAAEYVLGYTCINDVTAIHLLFKYDAFPQWTRSKSFDGFGIVGPCIATLGDPSDLVVQTFVNGEERQNYPVSDMVFSPLELVSKISGDMTLEPGDIIACGTSLGVKTLKPDSTVDVTITGIGTLRNRYMPDKQ